MLYDNIKQLCLQKKISVGSIEKALKFSNGSICKWNDSEPGIRKVEKVADYLGVSIENLLAQENICSIITTIPPSHNSVNGEGEVKKWKRRRREVKKG